MQTGTKVQVWNGDQSKYLGEGTLVGDVPIYSILKSEGGEMVLVSNPNPESPPDMTQHPGCKLHQGASPKIEMDDGTIQYGCQTWWSAKPGPAEFSFEETGIDALIAAAKEKAKKYEDN